MISRILQIIVLLCFENVIMAQNYFGFDQLPVHNYTRNDYQSGNQNWNIAQDNNGIIYFGNSNGLLVFNGNTWRLFTLPNQTTVRSVASDKKGRIYVGSFEEFGYFEPNEYGVLQYTSLSGRLKNYTFHNEEIWKIIIEKNDVYFQSFTVIFKFSKNRVEALWPGGFISCFSNVNNRLLVNISQKGLFELNNSDFKTVSEDSFFKSNEISAILPFNNHFLVSTSQQGVYLFNPDSGLNLWETALQQSFKHDQINRGIVTPDGKIVFGTILNGIYILTKNGTLLHHIEKRNGLQNNTILDLFCDNKGDLWAGLDHGIDLIVLNSDISFYYNYSGIIGSVYAIQLKDQKLYIGTNQGLYKSVIPKKRDFPILLKFNLLNNSQGQVWSIYNADNQVLCGHNKGTFEIEKDEITPVSIVSGGLSFEEFSHKGIGYLIGSTYTKLVIDYISKMLSKS